ncbi:MAG TPA: hypothetical protein VMH00_15625 [Candidatus Limnocylindrales bacterium]|nr:hypothetical protein [Candidatus Limnocylindrales bacterium]
MNDMRTTPPAGSAEFGPERRRTHRVQIAIPVIVKGQVGSKAIDEHTKTVVVNVNGCLVRMKTGVSKGLQLSLTNAATDETADVRVSYIGRSEGGYTEIGLGFVNPSPRFWRISFPPDQLNPDERKRFGPEK